MKTYISLLRGINVSGQKMIKMSVLCKLYEELDFSNVKSYLQSGNVVFNGKYLDNKELYKNISDKIFKTLGFEVPVIILSVEELENVISQHPFIGDASKDEQHFHVTFLDTLPEKFDNEIINKYKAENEDFCIHEKAIYLYCPNGYGRTKLTNNFFESKLKVQATTRNWKTTNELLKIAKGLK